MDVPMMLRVDLLSMGQLALICLFFLSEKRPALLGLVILKKYQKESIQELFLGIMVIKEK